MGKSLVKKLLLLVLTVSASGCASGGSLTVSVPSVPAPGGKDCSYHVEIENLIKVDVDDNKPIYTSPDWYGNKEEATFILIKREAGIPAWKVWGGHGGGEMDEIGVTVPEIDINNPDGQGKRVFIGLGHCRGTPGVDCLDPLPQSLLYVIQTEGACPPDALPRGDGTAPGFWWVFNVYFDTNAFEGDGSWKNENLPWWIKECVGGDDRGKQASSITAAVSEESSHPGFLAKSSITSLSPLPSHWEDVAESYKFDKTVLPYPADVLEKLGSFVYKEENFDVFYTLDPEGWLHLISQDNGGAVFQYEEINQIVPKGKTLQLGTFNPVRKFVYEWWTPSCKPVIYLYPKEQINLSISLKPFGVITKSEPFYPWPFGWKNILALPSGKLIYQGKEYSSLFYEGKIINVKVPSNGWVVKKENLSRFFDGVLPKLGLNQKESLDFKDYWLEKLDKGLYFITFLPREEIERVEPMVISTKPDTLIRVRLFFKALEKPVKVSQPRFSEVPKREGFTLIEWGGFYKE